MLGQTARVWGGLTTEGGGVLRKLLVGEARCRDALVRYYLLEEEGGAYGVGVETEEETALVFDLTPSRRKAGSLAQSLVRGAVTPVSLRDVVDDWLLQ